MTDLHCHILPGLDDGAADPATSCRMAEMAFAGGTRRIVCTPHCSTDDDALTQRSREILLITDLLQKALRQKGIGLELRPAMELLCTERLEEALRRQLLLPLDGNRYLLMEFYFDTSAAFINDCVRCAQSYGYTPVLAHPERYEALQRDPRPLAVWAQDCVIQVNKGSILGRFGPQAGETAAWLLHHELAGVVASDAHSDKQRTPDLTPAVRFVAERYSQEYAARLFFRNPSRIAEGKPLSPPKNRPRKDMP